MTETTTGQTLDRFDIIPVSLPKHYNINTTATYDGLIEICVIYDDAGLSSQEEDFLSLLLYHDDEWTNMTTSLNSTTNTICGTTPTLSVATIAVPRTDCGDANNDGVISIGDVVWLIKYMYKGGPKPFSVALSDVNNDGKLTILDVVYIINYKYKNGPDPTCM